MALAAINEDEVTLFSQPPNLLLTPCLLLGSEGTKTGRGPEVAKRQGARKPKDHLLIRRRIVRNPSPSLPAGSPPSPLAAWPAEEGDPIWGVSFWRYLWCFVLGESRNWPGQRAGGGGNSDKNKLESGAK